MNRRTLTRMALLGLVSTTLSKVGLAQTNLGMWKLNLATFTFQGEGQNLKNTSEGVDAEGKPTKAVFIHIYDGKPYQQRALPASTQVPTRGLMLTS